uniref:Ovule protein n=1 Tax=Brugia timori TaxID=42155 RepID=A0A0R3R0S6_9BILA
LLSAMSTVTATIPDICPMPNHQQLAVGIKGARSREYPLSEVSIGTSQILTIFLKYFSSFETFLKEISHLSKITSTKYVRFLGNNNAVRIRLCNLTHYG